RRGATNGRRPRSAGIIHNRDGLSDFAASRPRTGGAERKGGRGDEELRGNRGFSGIQLDTNAEKCDGWIEGNSCSQTGGPLGFRNPRRTRLTTPSTPSGWGIWEVDSSMLRVTCDLCGKEIRAGEDHRFVVKIEAYAAHDPDEITEAD